MNINQRRWFQFSIKSLLSLMLLIAVFFAGRVSLSRELQSYRRQLEQIYEHHETQKQVWIRYEKQVQDYDKQVKEEIQNLIN